ncbi:hypothetical protein [Rhodanobacter hydrolyticus]|uniref:Uncharacterized protein n=1 Tax=Rhodanobacter hydrolyticus TaxID=2250595 RepID=A0ABW8J1I3_9GAMM
MHVDSLQATAIPLEPGNHSAIKRRLPLRILAIIGSAVSGLESIGLNSDAQASLIAAYITRTSPVPGRSSNGNDRAVEELDLSHIGRGHHPAVDGLLALIDSAESFRRCTIVKAADAQRLKWISSP